MVSGFPRKNQRRKPSIFHGLKRQFPVRENREIRTIQQRNKMEQQRTDCSQRQLALVPVVPQSNKILDGSKVGNKNNWYEKWIFGSGLVLLLDLKTNIEQCLWNLVLKI